MNPHFLFNTLNNIYALAKQKSDHTPEMIMKLSEILDYTIYECRDDKVMLLKEWELIENYVDLEILRQSSEIELSLHQSIENSQAKVAPLILIAIVENAFKFGLGKSHNTPFIKINLTEKSNTITFQVENSIANHSNRDKKEGIGVQNIKRQLQLIYPSKHSFEVEQNEHKYLVKLIIQL